jgi:hypothetical protein
MDATNGYYFLTGLFIGGYSNFFSKIVISGLILYIVHPNHFNIDRFQPLYQRITERTYPYISKIYRLRGDVNGDMQNEEKVTIIDSPEPNSSISSISSIPSLPPLLKSLKLNVLK